MPTPATAAAGLAFAFSLTNGGAALTSDTFTLRVPGVAGAVAVRLEDPNQYGGTFASPVRLRNDSAGDLLATSLEVVSVSETRVEGAKTTTLDRPAEEGRPPAWDLVKKGDESSAQLLRAPVAAGEDLTLAVIMGRAHGVVALGAFDLEVAPRPEALLVETNGTVWLKDSSGAVVRTDERGERPVLERKMPEVREKPSAACAALKAKLCRETADGLVVTAREGELTVRDPDGKSRSFPAGGDGPVTAIALGREGRLLVATAGESGRRGSIRLFRPF